MSIELTQICMDRAASVVHSGKCRSQASNYLRLLLVRMEPIESRKAEKESPILEFLGTIQRIPKQTYCVSCNRLRNCSRQHFGLFLSPTCSKSHYPRMSGSEIRARIKRDVHVVVAPVLVVPDVVLCLQSTVSSCHASRWLQAPLPEHY
jgi:hypothetical protein